MQSFIPGKECFCEKASLHVSRHLSRRHQNFQGIRHRLLILRELKRGNSPLRVDRLGNSLHDGKRSLYSPQMSKLRRWGPIILCLLAVWFGVFLAVRLLPLSKPSAATVLNLLESKPGVAESTETRRGWITSFSSLLAALDLDSRHRILMDPRLRVAFMGMTPEDQAFFLKSIERPSFKEFIEGSKVWSVGRYERLTQPALADLETLVPDSTARFKSFIIDPSRWRLGTSGIESIFPDTAPLTRFDTLPLIERFQKYSQFGR